MFSMPFNINVESVPIDVQMEFIELQSDLDLKAKFVSKTLLEFYRVSPQNKISKDFKTCSKTDLFVWKYLSLRQFFFKMKYCKSKCRNRISDAHLHDTLRIAASSKHGTKYYNYCATKEAVS